MDKILIVEDSPVVQKLLHEILRSEFQLQFRDDGPSGLEAARAEAPDLILLDIRLPRMDGYEVCRALRQSEETKELPIIFLTSLDSEPERVKGFEAGADDYVVKPFYQHELLARVRAHLLLRKARLQAINLERLTVFREMAVAISHEINNPLTAIFAFLHFLQEELADSKPEILSAVAGIRGETKRIQQIVKQLGIMERIQKTSYNKDINMIDLRNT